MKSILLLSFCLNFFCTAFSSGQKAPSKPNIIIILADDMGYGDISGLNSESKVKTPHLDRLAGRSIVFSNAHAGASVCTPSRYGLLTGRFAFRAPSGGKGASGFGTPEIEPGRETIAGILRKAGYTTGCIGKWHLGLTWKTKTSGNEVVFDQETGYSNIDYSGKVTNGPNNHGFDYSFIHPASLDMPPYLFLRNQEVVDHEMTLTSALYENRLPETKYSWDKKHTKDEDVYWDKGVWWRRGEISRSFRIEKCLDEIVNEGLGFIEKCHVSAPGKPFFLYLPLTGPHTPWMPSREFRDKSDLGTYGDFVLNIDDVAGRIAGLLEKLSIDENTLVIFSSDNGAYWPEEEIASSRHQSNLGRRGQKGDIWEGGHRIPLLISWPDKIRKPGVNNDLVSLTDIYATLAELTGQQIGKNNGEDSFSFWGLLSGTQRKPSRNAMIHHSSNGMFAYQKDGWKFIDGLGSGGFTPPARMDPAPGMPSGQLYNLRTDSLEAHNVMAGHAKLADALKKELGELIRSGSSKTRIKGSGN